MPTIEELGMYTGDRVQGEIVAKGKPAQFAEGIFYDGPWDQEADGFCEHVRRCARALNDAGVPVQLANRQFLPKHFDEISELLLPRISKFVVSIRQSVPVDGTLDNIVNFRHRSRFAFPFDRKVADALLRKQVFYGVWEQEDIVNEADIDALKRMGQVWTACERNARMLMRAGVEHDRIRVIHVPHRPDDPLLGLVDATRRNGPVRFYSIGKWEPRKEQRNLIGAFMREFRPGEAQLFMKTSPGSPIFKDYPESPVHCVNKWLSDKRVKSKGWNPDSVGKSIVISREIWPSEKIVAFHAAGDVYCTVSRGEGFDMPAYDAKLAGRTMVYVPSGVHEEIASPMDFRVPVSGTVDCDPIYNWPGAKYLDYHLEDLQAALRKAFEAQPSRSNVDLSSFSMDNVGRRMKEACEKLISE